MSGPPSAVGAVAGSWLAKAVTRSGWSVRVHYRHLVPSSGPVILAPNHLGFVDGPLLFGVSPRPVHTLIKDEMFHGPLGWMLRGFGQIPVDRSRPQRSMLEAALGVLSAGRVLAIFPEGSRGSGEFAELHTGLAWFALRSGAPVVPVVFHNSHDRGRGVKALPRPRTQLEVAFGAPIWVESGGRRSKASLESESERLRAALVAHRVATNEWLGKPDVPAVAGSRCE